jgi:hypothetical protein
VRTIFNKLLLVVVIGILFSGCGLLEERYYKSVGFNNKNEVEKFTYENSFYFSRQLSSTEWDKFYKNFPEFYEYQMTSSPDVSPVVMTSYGSFAMDIPIRKHLDPILVAYAFKWSLINREKIWDNKLKKRLGLKILNEEDNIFKIVKVLGIPERVIWNNEHEVLLYKPNKAILLKDGFYAGEELCKMCYKPFIVEDVFRDLVETGMSDDEVIVLLNNSKSNVSVR